MLTFQAGKSIRKFKDYEQIFFRPKIWLIGTNHAKSSTYNNSSIEIVTSQTESVFYGAYFIRCYGDSYSKSLYYCDFTTFYGAN